MKEKYFLKMLIGCVTGPDFSKALAQVKKANALKIGIELRLDLFNFDSFEEIASLIKIASGPILLKHPYPSHTNVIKWAQLKADYLDLPWDFIAPIPYSIKILRSYHNTKETPKNLEAIIEAMPPADCYKIATTAHSTLDALHMLNFVKKQKNKLAGMCMGPLGNISRILGPIVGNAFDYCALEEKTAPGQLFAEEMLEYYHYDQLNSSTNIYGLIGNPVEQSPSFRTHNAFFRRQGINAVYVRILLQDEELPAFFSLAKQLEIRGLSVTIPFKEKIFPFLDKCDVSAQEIGAINTIKFSEDLVLGWNTDAPAAIEVLEKKGKVAKSRIAVLGAGGSARAIIYEAKKRGGEIAVYNRTISRAESLAKEFGCHFGSLENLAEYDILINTTPDSMPINTAQILSNKIVMDINLGNSKKELLEQAALQGCNCVRGEEMFERQALKQFALWFPKAQINPHQTLFS